MNRIDFMSRLSLLLSELPENERREAIQYYEDYLNDAGVENEEEVLAALGTPEELAMSIREGLGEGGGQQGEYSEHGFFKTGERLVNEVARREVGERTASQTEPGREGIGEGAANDRASSKARDRTGEEPDRRYRGGHKRKGMSGGMIALLVILCIIAAPVVIPVVFALAVVAAVLVFVAVLLAGIFLLVGVICIVAGVVALADAAAKLFIYPAGAVFSIGISLLTIGAGILLTLLIGWILSRVFPKAFRGMTGFVSGLFHRKGGNAA